MTEFRPIDTPPYEPTAGVPQSGSLHADPDRPEGGWRLHAYRVRREVLRAYRRYVLGERPGLNAEFRRPMVVPRIRKPSFRKLRAAYAASPLAKEPDTFVLYRIVGNDLTPRHAKGQSRANVAFILANEPSLPGCEKRWIVNRIVDPGEEAAIIALLEGAKQPYLRIPFDAEAYRRIGWTFEALPKPGFLFTKGWHKLGDPDRDRIEVHIRRLKNLYVMHNNGARNAALADGRGRAKWILPWDGNCFLTADAWQQIRSAVVKSPFLPYVVVPMARLPEHSRLAEPGFVPAAKEEPQVLFRRDARETFDERFPYGRRPKVELLWRLCVPGIWDRYVFDLWDFERPAPAAEAGQFQSAGWVARLGSGRAELEQGHKSNADRGRARNLAIIAAIDAIDARLIAERLDPGRLAFYDDDKIAQLADRPDEALFGDVVARAAAALGRGPYSVVDKTSLPPSGERHDYWHPAPYWWPDPDSPDGLPYIWRDGRRLPGTTLYDPESDQFDRTRLQYLFDDSMALALAWRLTGELRYAEHAALLIRRFFVDPETAMTPHLRYAQVRRGHAGDEGEGTGIIEFKDLYFFLDAVRLIERSGALDPASRATFRNWLTDYSTWLGTSAAGRHAAIAENNLGTFFDLQLGATAAFLGNAEQALLVLRRAQARLGGQIMADGGLPHELGRTRPRHYVCFCLQGWTALARICDALGGDLWSYAGGDGRSIGKGLAWLAGAHFGQWPAGELDGFDPARPYPLLVDLIRRYGSLPPDAEMPNPATVRTVFHPNDGIAPFWRLARD